MKSIELTEEHKSKLLEMCKVLFPEYKRIEITDYQIDIDRNHSNPVFIDLYKGELTVPFDIYSIHWFEFCMTHLTNALAGKNIKTDMFGDIEFEQARIKYLTELAKDRIKGQYHPIDYLYSEFLKLSK